MFHALADGRDELTGLHVNTTIPKIIGAARAYEVTGDNRHRRIAEFFWRRVALHRSCCTGGTSNYECWRTEPGKLAREISPVTQECCCTYNMLKLTRHVFFWTAEPAVADFYERALFNGILGTQNPDNGMTMYYVPLAPGYWKTFASPLDSFWCCTGTGVESFAKLGDSTYFRDDEGLWVNLFIASELSWPQKGLSVRQETRFPDQEGTTLRVAAPRPVEMTPRVRVPYWASRGATMRLNGAPIAVPAAPDNHDAIQYTWWIHAQPRPDQWRWFDDELALLQQNWLSLLGAFMTVPGWASGGSNTGYGSRKPPDLQLFGRYVHEVVGHYKDRIRVWEIWNEPHLRGFWDGTPEQYAAMAAVAYREAKRADPQCRVIGGGGVSLDPDSLRWTERAFAAGLLQSCDAVSFRYGYPGSAVPGPRKRFLDALATLRSMMRAHSGAKPLWNTEAAVPSTSFLNQYRAPRPESEAPYHFRRAADAMVQMLTVNLADGVEKVFYYDLVWPRRDGWVANLTAVPVQTSMLEGHGGPKPLAVAYATAAALLDRAQFVAVLEPAPSVPVYVFRRGQESVAVLWAEVGRHGDPLRLRLAHEGTWDLADVMNRRTRCGDALRVGRSPVFVIARSDPEGFQRTWRQARVAADGSRPATTKPTTESAWESSPSDGAMAPPRLRGGKHRRQAGFDLCTRVTTTDAPLPDRSRLTSPGSPARSWRSYRPSPHDRPPSLRSLILAHPGQGGGTFRA